MGKHARRPPEPGDYEVGYGKPPEHSRFPHQRRTPRKPKPAPRAIATRQFMHDFFGALETVIPITRNGKKLRLAASQVIQEQLVAKAVKGEAWAIKRVTDLQLALIRQYEAEQVEVMQAIADIEAINKKKPISPEAQQLLDELRERVNNPKELFRDAIAPRAK